GPRGRDHLLPGGDTAFAAVLPRFLRAGPRAQAARGGAGSLHLVLREVRYPAPPERQACRGLARGPRLARLRGVLRERDPPHLWQVRARDASPARQGLSWRGRLLEPRRPAVCRARSLEQPQRHRTPGQPHGARPKPPPVAYPVREWIHQESHSRAFPLDGFVGAPLPCLLYSGPRGSTVSGRHITYWTTSSARPSSDGGIVSPSALAVLRLMTSSNLVGCSIGRSAGLAPLKILST